MCLTFDGGYKDMITSAYPVLSRHAVPFTVYLPTAFPDRLGEAWWLALEQVIARESRISLVMDRQERHFEIADRVRQMSALRISLRAGCARWLRRICRSRSMTCASDTRVNLATLSREAIDGLGAIWQDSRPIRW